MRHGSGWIYRCVVRHFLSFFLSFFWVLGDAVISIFGRFGGDAAAAAAARFFLATFSKLARLVEKEGGRKTIKASSLAVVVVVVVFSLDHRKMIMQMISIASR